MTDERFMRSIATAFNQLADARTPDYLEAAIERASSRPQRPMWTLPGRWFPLDATTLPGASPSLPWRQLGVLALIAMLIATALAVYIGSQAPTPLPAPFGPAGNGLVAFARDGDIVVVDPDSGDERVIVGGPGNDIAPGFSRDGSQIVFEREEAGPSHVSHVMAVAPDGSGLTTLTSEPLHLVHSPMATPYTFAPDGRTVAIAAIHPDGGPGLLLAQADGDSARWLDLSEMDGQLTAIREPTFRPPDGSELLLTGDRIDGSPVVFRVDVASGRTLGTIVDGPPDSDLDGTRWSPDGRLVSYMSWSSAPGLTVRTHLVAPDGSGDQLLPAPPGMVYDIAAAWSNDGSRMFVVRGYTDGWDTSLPAIVPTDGSGTGVEIPYDGPFQSGCCYSWEWSPDDSMILGKPVGLNLVQSRQVIVDVASATIRAAPWSVSDHPAWQRVAPSLSFH
jgi:hypothetical protein